MDNFSPEIIEEAEMLAIQSSYYAKGRTNREYSHRGIQYEIPIGKDIVPFLRDRTELWEKMLNLTADYIKKGRKRSLRPTLDRINPEGNYSIDNLDVLTLEANVRKDKAVKIEVIDLGEEKLWGTDTMIQAAELLEVKRQRISQYCDSGVFMDDRYLIQSTGDRSGNSQYKVKTNPEIPIVLDSYYKAYYDEETQETQYTKVFNCVNVTIEEGIYLSRYED
ncbi:hypothetical protein [Pontibacillus salipaludis]|uniref:Uncharacterized protein n=1 Tax=Pontibacillus salipaludis TaxID=1697394 RepID=A0ABQ1PS48_9BACI|nr:hypothetical protein [Pontibacillus salipaludis]GGD02316.1 hypothetical protein GCM10011389_07210 [Pontibacillus salipaludis]